MRGQFAQPGYGTLQPVGLLSIREGLMRAMTSYDIGQVAARAPVEDPDYIPEESCG